MTRVRCEPTCSPVHWAGWEFLCWMVDGSP